jgi:hypothetical protein
MKVLSRKLAFFGVWAVGSVGLAGLTGCATTANYKNRVRSWEGQDVGALTRSWGPPDATEKIGNGDRVLVYARLHHEPYAFADTATKVASRDPGAVEPPKVASLYIKCATYFEVTPANRIFSVMFVGDQCAWKD